jgi:hypothetical protein
MLAQINATVFTKAVAGQQSCCLGFLSSHTGWLSCNIGNTGMETQQTGPNLLVCDMGDIAVIRSPLTAVTHWVVGSILGLGTSCELSCLLVLSLATRVFLRVLQVLILPP